jgi:hypothetical protein
MPYEIRKVSGGYAVFNSETGERKEKKAYPTREAAQALMRALYRVMSEKEKK